MEIGSYVVVVYQATVRRLARMFPKSNFRYINVPLIFGGSGMIPPATTINYTTWGIVGFVFNKYIKNKYPWATIDYIKVIVFSVYHNWKLNVNLETKEPFAILDARHLVQ